MQASQAPHRRDEGLPGNGAGSSRQRNGGSVYDMLVQEIKNAKLQQKTLARQLQDIQQDVSAASKQQSLNVDSLREELAEIRQQVCSNLPSDPVSIHTACSAQHFSCMMLPVGLNISSIECCLIAHSSLWGETGITRSDEMTDLNFHLDLHAQLSLVKLCCISIARKSAEKGLQRQ